MNKENVGNHVRQEIRDQKINQFLRLRMVLSNLKVGAGKKKIENGQFVIAGGQSGMEVSWTVTAERNDAYLQQNPEQREVELEKRDGQKGKYFMPHLFNQAADKAIFPAKEKVEQKEMGMMKK